MSDRADAPSGGLQFHRAEPAEEQPASPTACATCQQPLTSIYYQVDGNPTCERCKAQVEYDQMSLSPASNVLRAVTFGLLAALTGGALWYAVRATTGYEVGLIAVVVGLMVGGAVRAGCRRRGGVPYQVLAVALTYFGICVQYVPDIIKAIRDQPEPQAQTSSTTSPGPDAAVTPVSSLSNPPSPAPATSGVGGLLLALGLLLAFAMAAPFLGGFENILGILIIGFALWEAWKMNRRVTTQIEGPFRLAPAPAAVPVAPAG